MGAKDNVQKDKRDQCSKPFSQILSWIFAHLGLPCLDPVTRIIRPDPKHIGKLPIYFSGI